MPVFKIITLGCKVNQCESDGIGQCLKEKGFKESGEAKENPDLCIINTCAVTGKASMQSRQAIRKLIRENPDATIVVTGCSAQVEKTEIEKIQGVHHVVFHDDKERIPDLVLSSQTEISRVNPGFSRTLPSPASPGFWPLSPIGKRTRPFLKIQDGCNAFCNYCIVPYSRGRSRSMPSSQVISAIDHLSRAGYHEVVLTGIHLGVYGLDLSPGTTLFALLNEILKSSPIERIRLSSIEPVELSPALIRLVSDSPVLCDHFHIPLQSGCDTILKSMGRPYSTDFFEALVGQIREKIPLAGIGTDILTGYPGESEAYFNQTLDLLERVPISYFHVFPFSPRKGTPAYALKNRVPEKELKTRSLILRNLGNKKRRAFMEKTVGQTRKILIESQRDRETGLLKGLSSEYIHVLVDGPDADKNTLQNVRIDRVFDDLSTCGVKSPL